ncbi:Similar to mblac1: Metallo-beta-lactamase domain-containing protein 1 (Xenopus laevis), partial [Cotesia congregata]
MMYQVIVLFNGYSKQLKDGKSEANCSCTLIKGQEINIIVDTMTAWDRDKILTALRSHNVKPEEINYVVCTHSHADHIGNNNLFTHAQQHIVGYCIHRENLFDELQLSTKEADIADPEIWKSVGKKELEKIQAKNRLMIIKSADYIVPGHGPMFKVTEDMIRQLESQ